METKPKEETVKRLVGRNVPIFVKIPKDEDSWPRVPGVKAYAQSVNGWQTGDILFDDQDEPLGSALGDVSPGCYGWILLSRPVETNRALRQMNLREAPIN